MEPVLAAVVDRLESLLGAAAARDAPLGARTTYRVGGPASLVVEVGDDRQLDAVTACLAAAPGAVPILVLGNGSNLLVADRGFAGVVVTLGAGFSAVDVRVDGEGTGATVRAGAAVSLPVLARRTVAAGLRGMEWSVGVPGSVGGAVRMNAGGHGAETRDVLLGARWVDLVSGETTCGDAERLGLGYRRSVLGPCDLVVEATFGLEVGDADAGGRALTEVVRWRREHQPGGSNAGSVFQNPPGASAGALVDAAGLKGFRMGTAQVSPKHANFIQADPGGSADDVVRLIRYVQDEVERATGVLLHPEVRLVGFAPELCPR
ncbi:MAG: UDP-N-acetylmuramate dehydrogenase [Actinomycetota bacterium]|nr:UDP-N-acetylmuramate dehydrogenase [Actinomycetota bacterium]